MLNDLRDLEAKVNNLKDVYIPVKRDTVDEKLGEYMNKLDRNN